MRFEIISLKLLMMDDTLDNFADFFEENFDTCDALDVWDPIFLSQETTDDKERRLSHYCPVVEDISDHEEISGACAHPVDYDKVPNEDLQMKSIGMDKPIVVPGGHYFNGVWCPRDPQHAMDIDALLTSKIVKFFFFDNTDGVHEFISEEDIDRALV